jgi:monofunctional biosynthetic peptidoglycan transglycosylase
MSAASMSNSSAPISIDPAMAAALPLPKKRSVKNPSGFVRRYGNSIARRIRIVQRDGLDSCARP